MSKFKKELEALINNHNIESESNTPDFILATYLHNCLAAYEIAIIQRDDWYDIKLTPEFTVTK